MRSCSTLPTAITTRGDALSIIATRSASLLRMPSRRRKTSGGWAEGEEVIISDTRGDTMRSWITVCVGAVLFVQPAAAGTIEERVCSAFEALCLDNMREIGRVPSFAGAIGMVELSGEKAKLVLDGHPGHAWISGAKETARYALILTDEGFCGVTGPDANGKGVLALFLSNSRNQRLSTAKIGSSVQSVFAVTHPSRRGLEDIHAIVSITTPNLQTIRGVNLSAVSEALASANGIRAPVWP
jgi:hypothetical protein